MYFDEHVDSCIINRVSAYNSALNADYECVNGEGTMTACYYDGAYGSATCNGGYSHREITYPCKFLIGHWNPFSDCNDTLPETTEGSMGPEGPEPGVYINLGVGGMDEVISCSCD